MPGLAQLPVLGRLFQSRTDTANKTEIVLLITPRVLRNIERPGASQVNFTSGTELEVGGGGGAPAPGVFQPAPMAPPTPTAPPAGVFQPSQIAPAPGAPASPPSILPPPRSQ